MQQNPENYQYDSCVSRGICSVNPRTSALTVVLVIFLKLTAKFLLKIYKKIPVDKKIKNFFLKTVTISASQQEFCETYFLQTVKYFKEILPDICQKCSQLNENGEFKNEDINSSSLFNRTNNITDSIRFGEKVLQNAVSKFSSEIRDLHQTIMVVSGSLSHNLLNLDSFGQNYDEEFLIILDLFDAIGTEGISFVVLKEKIVNAAKINNNTLFRLRSAQENRYGKQQINEVSYSTTPGKAVLVAGSDISELENILEALKNKKIDVYTHDDMMLAHTFPKFSEYKSLKGQFGQGLENCLIDFATFPGPIILTKQSLHNIENLYRGRLFTTDDILPQGIIKIENNDFSGVIDSAFSAKGFKKGKICESTLIGYDFEKTVKLIKEQIKNKKRIIMIGAEHDNTDRKVYFKKLVKHIHKDSLIITFSYEFDTENCISLNACFDNSALIKIYETVKDCGIPVIVFMPDCSRDTISQIIYLANQENTAVYVGKCTPIILNPSLLQTLNKIFGIKSIDAVKKDMKDITGA